MERAKKIYQLKKKIYQENYRMYLKKYSFYLKELSNWEKRYLRYKEDYEYYKRKCSLDKNWCDEMNYYKKILKELEKRKPQKPVEPKILSFDEILKKQQNLCIKRCECKEMYDICFQACGGKVILRKICVENCQ